MFLASLPIYKKLTFQRSARFAEYLNPLIPDHSHIMDFGCGNMFTSLELVRRNPTLRVTGIDVVKDQNLDDSLFNEYPLEFRLAETRELPFPDEHFDTVLALATMHHTDDPEYYLSELKRVIKPNGAILLVEEMYINALDKLLISSEDWILNKMKKGIPVPLNFRSHRHYLNTFDQLGLQIDFEGSVRSFPMNMHHYVFKLSKKEAAAE